LEKREAASEILRLCYFEGVKEEKKYVVDIGNNMCFGQLNIANTYVTLFIVSNVALWP
jgi:hypothetical protein